MKKRFLLTVTVILLVVCATTVTAQTAQELLNRGNSYANNGDHDRAIADYTAALRIQPAFAEALFMRGSLYAINRDFDSAVTDFTAAIRINPDHYVKKIFDQGVEIGNMGGFDFAIACYTSILTIQPGNVNALYNRSFCSYCKGDFNKSIMDSEAVLRIDPNYDDARDLNDIARQKRGY